jgi:glycosyltransferase involved in cell wall biosynthesis
MNDADPPADLGRNAQPERNMKICHVTTYWPTCNYGHTHYTENLMRGMRLHQPEKHYILAAEPAAAVDNDEYQCIPCFRSGGDFVPGITAAARQVRPDIAIIQSSPDLFGLDNRLPDLVTQLAAMGIHPVVNSHSIYAADQRSGFRPGGTAADFDRALAQHAALLSVHSERMRSDLLARGVPPEKVVVLPHGSKPMAEFDQRESRARLGLPENAKVVLFFGFIWLGKGIDFLLRAFARVARRLPEAYLYVGGHTRSKKYSAYVTYLRARAYLLGFGPRARFWGSFVPEEMVPVIYSAADVVALPYRQDYSSVSGVVHQTSGIGKLLLCSRISKFDEVTTGIDPALTVPEEDVDAWADTLVRLLTDETWAAELRAKIRRFAEATSWANVGKMHLATYAKLLEGKHHAHSR